MRNTLVFFARYHYSRCSYSTNYGLDPSRSEALSSQKVYPAPMPLLRLSPPSQSPVPRRNAFLIDFFGCGQLTLSAMCPEQIFLPPFSVSVCVMFVCACCVCVCVCECVCVTPC